MFIGKKGGVMCVCGGGGRGVSMDDCDRWIPKAEVKEGKE